MSVMVRIVAACVFIAGMLIGHTLIIPSLFVAPFTGLVIIFIFSLWQKPQWIQKIFLFGKAFNEYLANTYVLLFIYF